MIRVKPDAIKTARDAASMSRTDLAMEIRKRTGFKTDSSNVRDWERGDHSPRDGVVPAIADATGHAIEFFYESGGDDELDEEAALRRLTRDIGQAMLDRIVERRVEQRLSELHRRVQ